MAVVLQAFVNVVRSLALPTDGRVRENARSLLLRAPLGEQPVMCALLHVIFAEPAKTGRAGRAGKNYPARAQSRNKIRVGCACSRGQNACAFS